jgi:hypothetical protein
MGGAIAGAVSYYELQKGKMEKEKVEEKVIEMNVKATRKNFILLGLFMAVLLLMIILYLLEHPL